VHPCAATQAIASDHTSLHRWAPALSVFLSSGPRLPTEVGSSAVMCPMAPGSASPRWELLHCHVFVNSGPRLPVEVCSDAVTWPQPRLSERRAPMLLHTPRPPAGCGPLE
jgi:hypothetical protein